jgi:aminoglycoside 3-N-acetyltransferase I
MDTSTKRLTRGDDQDARDMFTLVAAAFEEPAEPLSDEYIDLLLSTSSFWAVAAFQDGKVVGGLTAHTIPMTRSPSAELFVFDLAVHEDVRRQGVGARLVATLRELAAEAGVTEIFVPADEDDSPALDFYRALDGQESPVRFFTWDAERT